MALVGVALETLVFEPDAQTTRPPPIPIFLTIRVFFANVELQLDPKRYFSSCKTRENSKL